MERRVLHLLVFVLLSSRCWYTITYVAYASLLLKSYRLKVPSRHTAEDFGRSLFEKVVGAESDYGKKNISEIEVRCATADGLIIGVRHIV